MHNRLTILLTLKDRHAYTLRWLKWANSQECPFQIFIADGSRDETAKSYLTQENTNHLKIEYIRYNPDQTLRDWFFKLQDVLSRIDTKYTIQTDNDDFLLFTRLLESVTELELYGAGIFYARPQYRVGFDVSGGRGGSNTGEMLYPRRRISVQRWAPKAQELGSPDAMTRLEFAIKNPSPATFWYGIHSTSMLKSIHDFVFTEGIQLAFFQEWLLMYNTVIKNRILYHDSFPYLVRQEFTSGEAAQLYESEALDRIFLNRSWSDDLHTVIAQLHRELQVMDTSVVPEDFEQRFKVKFRSFLLRWNRSVYLSHMVPDSHLLRVAHYLYRRYRYAHTHDDIRRYRNDREFMKLQRFLLPK